MIVLGLSAFGENPSACLVVDGKLVAFCQEDRFTRLKGSHGQFPTQAVGWCLASRGLTLGDVSRIAVGWGCDKYPWQMMVYLARMAWDCRGQGYVHPPTITHPGGAGPVLDYLYRHTPGNYERRIRDALRASGHSARIPPIDFVEHHRAHAVSAFAQSPFAEAAVLVVDGSGEERTVTGFTARNNAVLRQVFAYDVPHSLGWFYAAFTAYLGFHPSRDEGKVMGLAAFGEERKNRNPWIEWLDRVLLVTPGGFELDPLFVKSGGNEFHPRFTDHLYRYVTSRAPELTPVGVGEMARRNGSIVARYLLDGYVDLAYAVQRRLEEALVALVRRLVRETGMRRICLAGGVAMNCKANHAIEESAGVEEVFVHPAASDDGTAIGAALAVAADGADDVRNPLVNPQLGPSYSDAEVQAALRFARLEYTSPRDLCTAVADMLAAGRIVGWFQGGAEMGARALGGRSIVATPQDPVMRDRINDAVKRREGWRPYAPSLVFESRRSFLGGDAAYPFMIVARSATPLARLAASATVHVDGTLRPQTVTEQAQPIWHRLLRAVERHSGHPVVLNTSMNVRGEPMVCTPLDAIRCFCSTGMDALAIGDFLVTK